MNPNPNSPAGGLPAAADDVPPDRDTMFPKPDAATVGETKDAAVGIEDPRKEADAPEGLSAPFADGR
jgi:hypothetical protein